MSQRDAKRRELVAEQHQHSDAYASDESEEDDDEEAYHARPRPKVQQDPSSEVTRDELHPTEEAALDPEPALDGNDGEPYFNEDEYEPVSPMMHAAAELDPPEVDLVIPDPPPVESAIPQDAELTTPSVDSAAALQKALNAWYTAGYAAALYHVKAGMVQP